MRSYRQGNTCECLFNFTERMKEYGYTLAQPDSKCWRTTEDNLLCPACGRHTSMLVRLGLNNEVRHICPCGYDSAELTRCGDIFK